MKLLIDADFLVALAEKDDVHHAKAVEKADTLSDATLFVTPFTIPEAATVLSYKVSGPAARDFLLAARRRTFIELAMDDTVKASADAIFLSRNEKGVSWIDCLNVAIIRLYQLDGILSYDKFYKKLDVAMG